MRSLKIFAVLVALNAGAWITLQEASAQQVSASFRLFYDALSPYGTWVDYQNYGYVWMPNTDPDFSPYVTSGHWVFTDDGWTWVSDYPWGWATFHYGRWDYDDVYGWFWVPDNEWGPAWVSWRSSPGYYGWAPLRPGISLSMSFGRDYRERNERWIFVRNGDIARSDIGSRYINRTNNTTIINNSTVIVNAQRDDNRNATYIAGPNRADVQRVTHMTVNPVVIRDANQPGHHLSNSELQIYRPQIQKRNGNGQDPAPAKVAKLSDVRPASERNAGSRQQQPPTLAPPAQAQPSQPRAVTPSATRDRQQQPRTVTPPIQVQPSQARTVSPSASRVRQQQSRAVTPGKTAQPKAVTSSVGKGAKQLPPKVAPSNRGQSPQPLKVDPSTGKGKQKQSQNVPPPQKVDPAQPNKKQDEKPKQREQ